MPAIKYETEGSILSVFAFDTARIKIVIRRRTIRTAKPILNSLKPYLPKNPETDL